MVDALGWRLTPGVVAPSTNTVAQPEFDATRPPSVTNHFGRIRIPVRRALMAAIDRVTACEPDHLAMGPVIAIAITTATCRWALRRNGIADRIDWFGCV